MRSILAALVVAICSVSTVSAENEWEHATALVGEPKYPPDFKHFDYVNPDAPKGGLVRLSVEGTFDNFNFVIPKGALASGLGLIYETLMTSSDDEISAEYGLLADALKHPDDYSSVTYRLRPEARWHDGTPITPEDVVWSFEVQKEHDPQRTFYYRHVVKAEKTGDREVTFSFDQTGNRELPHIVGQLFILPKHWWTANGANGKPRDITATTLEMPMGSGPYKIKTFDAGRTLSYERISDHWGKDLPVNVGANNFDEIRYEYFRDNTVELEAFKSDKYDWRVESTAKDWATAYDIPAVRDGRIIKNEFEEPYRTRGLMVGFIPNLRREKFQNPKLREALLHAYNFEEMNRSIFFGQYERIQSYFFGIPLASSGLPEGKELEILETVRDKVPPEVFTKEYVVPVSDTPGAARQNLRKAFELLQEAGYERKGTQMVDKKTGEPLEFEYLLNGPSFERVALRLKENLGLLGVKLNVRSVDSSQYINRLRNWDFDLIYTGWAQSMSPGNEQLEFFGSASADREGSRNVGGIKNEAVDALIQKVIYAKDRDELIAATKALDRVLLWNHYTIPGWTQRASRVARWDRFSHPEPLPQYAIGFPTIWWYDEEKAAKTGVAK